MKPHGAGLAILCLPVLLATSGCRHTPVASAPVYAPPPLSSSPRPVTHAVRRPVPVERTPEASVADSFSLGKPISTEVGLASWYGPPYHHRQAADGSVFDQNALTVAHRTLPLGTTVRVTNLATNESVIARVTDRGPFIPNRTLDLSLAAAKAIGVYRAGVAKVKVEAFASQKAEVAGRWCVQIGVFIDPEDSLQLKNDLQRRFTAAKVIEFTGPTGHWVRINPTVADQATAQKIADSIHLPDATPYLIRTN